MSDSSTESKANRLAEAALQDARRELSTRDSIAWECKIVILGFSASDGIDRSEGCPNDEGSEGWELVSMVQRRDNCAVPDCLAVMKRRKRAPTQI